MQNTKGAAGILPTILTAAVVLLVILGLFATFAWIKGGDTLSINKGADEGEFSYAGKNVKVTLDSSNIYTAASVDPTFYVYDEQPDNWGNGRTSVEDGYVSSVSSSSGSGTVTELPGTYWVRAELTNYYSEFFTVDVPSSGDSTLNDYNQQPEIKKVQLIDVEALSVSNQDMGITTNESSDKTYHVFANFNVDDDEGFILEEVKLREDATYSFATDTDGDGVYDEGINEIVVTVDGKKTTVFDAAGSINEFSGDDEAIIEVGGVLYDENDVVPMKFEVTCDATLDTTGDADEKCGDGEDFIDDVVLVDAAGNTATFHLVG